MFCVAVLLGISNWRNLYNYVAPKLQLSIIHKFLYYLALLMRYFDRKMVQFFIMVSF